jgi:signal transduction histidine kinase
MAVPLDPADPALADLLRRLAEAEARAEHAERLATLGRLLTGVVHEINNPLTAVTMYADVLAARLTDLADREKASAILSAGLRIQALTRELVGFVRPGREPDAVHALSDLVDEALRLARPELKASGARVVRQDAPAAVRGKRQSLVQVVLALVANAAAAGEAHTIRISVGRGEEGAVLAVNDEGAGMAPEVLARAFEPFFTTRPDRLGLGLTTARLIVERHGGRVSLDSEAGRGTTATVVLPLADDSTAQP